MNTVVFYAAGGLVLYWSMRGLDALFKKTRGLIPITESSTLLPTAPPRTTLAAIIVIITYMAIVWISALRAGFTVGYSLGLIIGVLIGEALAMVFWGWLFSLPFRYIYRQMRVRRRQHA